MPKRTRNLLTAGRCISTTQEVNGSVGLMVTATGVGEAGTAAALCTKKKSIRGYWMQVCREGLLYQEQMFSECCAGLKAQETASPSASLGKEWKSFTREQ